MSRSSSPTLRSACLEEVAGPFAVLKVRGGNSDGPDRERGGAVRRGVKAGAWLKSVGMPHDSVGGSKGRGSLYEGCLDLRGDTRLGSEGKGEGGALPESKGKARPMCSEGSEGAGVHACRYDREVGGLAMSASKGRTERCKFIAELEDPRPPAGRSVIEEPSGSGNCVRGVPHKVDKHNLNRYTARVDGMAK